MQANPSWASGHEHRARDQQPLRAEAVEQHPDRDLHRGVHQQLETVNVESWEAVMWKRSAAARPATPSEERWKIARK